MEVVPSWFDSNKCYVTMASNKGSRNRQAPVKFPGFRYIPNAGFTGLDSFTYKVITDKGSSDVAVCKVRVTPPEPGNMSVLLIVNSTLLTSINNEVNRLKSDLIDEGYTSRVISFPQSGTAKGLWDTLVAEYDSPNSMIAGAILIGTLPILTNSINKGSAYWCMSKWEGDMDADTTIGYRTGYGGYGLTQYTPGFMNIWVSHMYGAGSTALGSEIVLTKRILQNNHDYRKGISRLPHKAYGHNMNASMKQYDFTKYGVIWPSYEKHAAKDSTHPFVYEFKKGGELWDIVTHGNVTFYNSVYDNSSGIRVWGYYASDSLYSQIFSIRFLLSNNCHTGGFGSIANKHLLLKNSSCVLAMAPTDYVSWGYMLNDTASSSIPGHNRTRELLGKGERFGRTWLRANGWIWSSIFHGDLSLKPMMGPANNKPVINSISAVKVGDKSWQFTVGATDSDDGIKQYEWYGESYLSGKNEPDSIGSSVTFTKNYSTAKICTVRVEAVDHYLGRDYATVILKTDSGVIANNVFTSTEDDIVEQYNNLEVEVKPNPFNPACEINFAVAAKSAVSLSVYSLAGVKIRTLVSGVLNKGDHHVSWNGKDDYGRKVSAGLYVVQVGIGKQIVSSKVIFAK